MLLGATILLWPCVSHGRIGETPMQCFKRYGKVIKETSLIGITKQVEFQSDEFTVTAVFIAGKAECLAFHKLSGDLTSADVAALFENNGMDISSVQEDRKKVWKDFWLVTWTHPNRFAWVHPIFNQLIVCSDFGFARVQDGDTDVHFPDDGAAEAERRKAAEKQKASESLEGF